MDEEKRENPVKDLNKPLHTSQELHCVKFIGIQYLLDIFAIPVR